MASNFEECPTGILVDYIGNITVSMSSDCNKEKELEANFNEKDTVSSKPSHDTEEQSLGCRTPFVKSGAINIPNNHCLGSELNRKRYEVRFSQTQWRTPSPTTMNMITFEASRIVDQLHTTMETSLWEEEFPLTSDSENECFEDCSNEFDRSSQNVTVIKFCNEIDKSPSSNEKNNVENGNLTENLRVFDNNSIVEGNSVFSPITTCADNSNVKTFKENCESTENCNENVENGFEKEEAFVLLKSPCVDECSTTTARESNLILENFKVLTVESSAATEKLCPFTEEAITLTEEDSALTEEGSTLIKKGLTEECVTGTSEGSTLIEEGLTLTEEGLILTGVHCTPIEGNFVQGEESFGVGEKRCVTVAKSCIIVTKETSKYENIGTVAEDNFSEFAEVSNSEANPVTKVLSKEVYANTYIEQNRELHKITPEAKVTPSSIKSKFTKMLKTPCFKTPIKYKKLEEKENLLPECKGKNVLSERKISQVSSMKGILSVSNSKESIVSTSKSSIKASFNKSISVKSLFGRENKSTVSVPKVQANGNLDTPLKKMNLLKFQPDIPKKTPVCKSYSVADTPKATTPIRRSSSFQTRQTPNTDQLRRERSFVAESRPKNWNSRMSLIQTQRIGSELKTPSKIGSYLPKSSSNVFATPSKIKSVVKESQVPCPSFATPLRQTKSLDQSCPQVFGFKRPASTTSKTRFVSRLELPSPLPKKPNGSLSRRLSPDYNTPLKRRI